MHSPRTSFIALCMLAEACGSPMGESGDPPDAGPQPIEPGPLIPEITAPSVEGASWRDRLEEGVWFVGWPAGFNHYSWLRFTPNDEGASQGTFAIVDPDCGRCVAYLQCPGVQGQYAIDDGALVMGYPAACALDDRRWSFGEPGPPQTLVVNESFEAWPVTLDDGKVIEAIWFDSSQCEPDFSSCRPL